MVFNPLECKGNYSATSNNMKLVHWLLVGGLLHLVQRGWDWVGCKAGPQPPRPFLAVPNITAHPSTASVPVTILLYNGPLPCSFNVSIKGLIVYYQYCTWSYSCTYGRDWFATIWRGLCGCWILACKYNTLHMLVVLVILLCTNWGRLYRVNEKLWSV